MTTTALPGARRTRGTDMWVAIVVGLGLTALGLRAVLIAAAPGARNVTVIYLITIGYLAWQFVFSRLDGSRAAQHGRASGRRARERTPAEHSCDVSDLRVVALVPAYNEDPQALRMCLESLLDQARPLYAISVVDDGSTTGDYEQVRAWFMPEAARVGVRAHWQRQVNGGKRTAQVAAARVVSDADVFLTVDSDSLLDRRAVHLAVAEFADPQVQSVAAVILTTNYRRNLLTRIEDLYCTSLQIFERSALSRFGAVLVNCGGCAFYRAGVLLDNADEYLHETLLGKPMTVSDDSLLTLFALQRGRAVQQPDAFAFTLMPEKFSHMRRQQLRWMRGSFVRSGWRMRYLPLGRAAYWLHLARWIQFAMVTAALVAMCWNGQILHPATWIAGAGVSAGIYGLVAARYLSIRRSDQTTAQRWAVFALAPVVALFANTVLKVLRWYAMATFWKVSTWGTRTDVEVAAA